MSEVKEKPSCANCEHSFRGGYDSQLIYCLDCWFVEPQGKALPNFHPMRKEH